MGGRTTVIVAHRLSTVRKADVIAVMQRGRVVETGKHTSCHLKKPRLDCICSRARLREPIVLPGPGSWRCRSSFDLSLFRVFTRCREV